MAFQFQPVTEEDLPLLERWIGQPHWQEWWGDVETEIGYIKNMLAGQDSTRPYLFCRDREPIGYIQYWHVGDAQVPPWSEEEPWVMELAPDIIGIDLAIGDAENLSKGIGTQVLEAFVSNLQAEGFERIIIDPDASNKRAIRTYEKAGFVPIEHLKDKTGDVLVMEFTAGQTGTNQ